MEDKSRIFKDFNFKLVVINSLIHKNPSFIQEFNEKKNTNDFFAFLENILLSDEDMDKVDSIQLGDHLEIYQYLASDYNTEIQSMDDVDLLYNLKSIEYE